MVSTHRRLRKIIPEIILLMYTLEQAIGLEAYGNDFSVIVGVKGWEGQINVTNTII